MKPRSVSLILISILFLSVASKAQFREIYAGTNMNNDIKWTSFLTPSTGFVAFTFHAGFTTDSGRSFSLRGITLGNVNFNGYNPDLTLGFTCTGVKALSIDSVFAFGHYTSQPSILFSANGGTSWKLVYHSGNGGDLYNKIYDLDFPGNASLGMAIQHDRILRSLNRGQNWVQVASGSGMENMNFPTSGTGYVTTLSSILKTNNSGANWTATTHPSGNGNGFSNVSFLTPNKGYVTGGLANTVFRTENGGSSWIRMNDNELVPVSGSDMHFVNDSIGYICEFSPRQVYKTYDSGKTWERCKKDVENQYLGYGFYKMQFLNDQVWAAGGGEYLMLAKGDIPVYPSAFFKIDTTGYYNTGNVQLKNYSRNVYSYKWFKNDTLVSTSYNAVYSRVGYPLRDSIKLIVSDGTFADTSILHQDFVEPQPAPVVTAFTPSSGGKLTNVTITGSGFTGASRVTFGGVPAFYFSVASNSVIYAMVGVNGGTGAVGVSKPASAEGVLPGFVFIPTPTITTVSANSAAIGDTIHITGTHFNTEADSNHVFFGNAKAQVITAGATSLSVKVPNAAGFSKVFVTPNTYTAATATEFNARFTAVPPDAGSYIHKTDLPAGLMPRDVAAGDLDGDGRPDIAVTCRNSSAIFVYRNTGTGNALSFAAPVVLSFPYYEGEPVRILMTDRNGDGKLDLISSHNQVGGLAYSRNTSTPGNISFAAYVTASASGSKFYNNVESLATDDFNRDGKADFLLARKYNGWSNLFLTQRNFSGVSWGGSYQLPYAGVYAAGMMDIDGDGYPDVLQSTGGEFSVRRQNFQYENSVSFDNAITFPAPYNSTQKNNQLAAGDLDNDGKRDIVVTDNEGGTIYIYRNLSTPGAVSLAPYISVAAGSGPSDVEIADVDGDGKPDVLVTCIASNKVILFRNISAPGTIAFAPGLEYNTGSGPEGIAVIDMNGDNIPEVITANTTGNNISILKNFASNFLTLCTGTTTTFLYASNVNAAGFQWQADTGSGYANLLETPDFTGTQTHTLRLSNINDNWYGYKFRCIAGGTTEDIGVLKFANSWTGAESNAWSNPLNWSCGVVPGTTTDVTVTGNNNILLSSAVTIGSITLLPGTSVILRNGGILTLTH